MPLPDAALAAMPADERRQQIRQTETELRTLQSQLDELKARAQPLIDLLGQLQRLDDADLIAGRAPAEVFGDPELLRTVTQREWNHGRGSRELSDFLTAAFSGLDEGIGGFEREVSGDYTTVVRLMPRLSLRYAQDVSALADALRTVHAALAVDGVMKVDIDEHACGELGIWSLEMPTPETAILLRNQREDRRGTLTEILDYVAECHWSYGYPSRHAAAD